MKSGDLLSEVYSIEFDSNSDDRGELIAIEHSKEIPFTVKRIYYIFKTKKGAVRGHHAHINLEQLAICVKGSCTFDTETIKGKESYVLDTPSKGLYIGGLVWREMRDFSDDCVLIVLASELYDEDDYIRHYPDFIQQLREQI